MFIAITTYGKPENTYYQVMNMYDKKHIYYIHYNRCETKKNLKKLRDLFSKYPNVNIISKYKVYWGEISITKSTINMMKIFLKSNEDHFIHLGAKEINIKPINMIEKILKKSNNVNYMNFAGDYRWWFNEKIGLGYNHIKKYECLRHRKYFKYLLRFSKSKFKYFIYILIIFRNIFSLKIFQILLCILNFDKFALDKLLFYNNINDENHSYLQFNKKKNKIPKKLKNMTFIFDRIPGPLLILKKSDVVMMLENDLFKKILKYYKKLFAPEESFFHTLYFNIIGSTTCSRNPLALNKEDNQKGIVPKKCRKEDFLFLRRVYGEHHIIKINKIYKL